MPKRRKKTIRKVSEREAARRRVAIKRQLRRSGVSIPDSAMFDTRKLRALRKGLKKNPVRRKSRKTSSGFKVVTQIEGCKVAIPSGSFESAIRKAHALHRKTGTPATVLHGGAKLGVSTKRGFKY